MKTKSWLRRLWSHIFHRKHREFLPIEISRPISRSGRESSAHRKFRLHRKHIRHMAQASRCANRGK